MIGDNDGLKLQPVGGTETEERRSRRQIGVGLADAGTGVAQSNGAIQHRIQHHGGYPIQICNHNLLLADAIHRGMDRTPILPDSCAIIIDEAHKLPETARQMFGTLNRAMEEDSFFNCLWVEGLSSP